MAIDIATARTEIAKLYIAAFNRVPDSAGLNFWVDSYVNKGQTLDQIANNFTNSTEYTTKYPSYQTNAEYVEAIYVNVFGRASDAAGKAYWEARLVSTGADALTHGTLMNAMVAAAAANGSTDGTKLANQATFAVNAVLANIDTASATAQLANVTSDTATIATATTAATTASQNVAGQTFTLTAGVDTLTGTAANDTFVANQVLNVATGAVTLDSFTNLDSINGGEGTDTLSIRSAAAITDPTGEVVTSVENVSLESAGTVAMDTSAWTGTTQLTSISVGDADLTAAATTNVTSTTTAQAANNTTVTGGNNVTVTNSGTTTGTTTVTNAAGVVTVSTAIAANTAAAGAISVTGGTTVSVTETIAAPTAGVVNATVGQGNVTVTGTAATTAVTVDQAAATAGTKEVFTVKYAADTAGSTTLIFDGVTTTTAAGAQTAAQVAAAVFAAGATTNYNVSYTAGSDTVTFTAKVAGAVADVTDVIGAGTYAGVPTYTTTTQGIAAVTNGTVTIADKNAGSATAAATIATVTLSDYANSTISSNALSTLNLSGTAGTLGITTGLTTPTNTTLTMNVNGLSGTNTITDSTAAAGAGYTTLNINATGANSTIADLAFVDATTLNVAGDKVVTVTATTTTMDSLATVNVSGAAGLTANLSSEAAVKTVTSTSTGNSAVTVANTATTVTMAGGNDSVAYTGAIGATTRVDLGAGDDTLTIAAASLAGASITGGTGDDTLVVTDGAFINGAVTYNSFEIADITGIAASTLSMANLASATKVVGKGTYGNTALTNVAAGTTVSLTSVASTNTTTTGTLSYALADATGTDSVSLSLNSKDTDTNTAALDDVDGNLTVTSFTANDIETFNITSTATTTDGDLAAKDYTNTIVTLAGDKATTINVDGASNLSITTLNAALLTKFDAHTATGNISVNLSNATGTVAYLGSAGVDTVTTSGSANDIVQGNGGADVITFTNTVKETLKIAADTDSVLTLTDTTTPAVTPVVMDTATGYDSVTNFESGTDKIELSSALGLLTGDARSAIAGKGTIGDDSVTNAELAAALQTLIGTGADFFNDGTADRALAQVIINDATDATMLFIDTNADGNFTNGVDQAIYLTGVTTGIVVTDVVFG